MNEYQNDDMVALACMIFYGYQVCSTPTGSIEESETEHFRFAK